jgi:hypothetical protein
MHGEAFVWEKVEWRQGDGRYVFEVARGGLHGTLTAPGGRSLMVPMVAWYGLLDALRAARKARERADKPIAPRSHARWSPVETDELVAAFRAGSSVAALAAAHNRSEWAVEAQLAQKGLWDRVSRQPL